jgi:hypothetical protein
MLRKAILSALRKDDLTHTELFSRLKKSLKASFQEISTGMAKPLSLIWKPKKQSKEPLQSLKNIG